jgi:serine acetyltransferase
VRIGRNAVVGAGAVVSRSVPENTIVAQIVHSQLMVARKSRPTIRCICPGMQGVLISQAHLPGR